MPGTHTSLSMPPHNRLGTGRFQPSEAEAPTADTLRKEARFREGLRLIALQRSSHVAFEDLYRVAYNMVLIKRGPVVRQMADDLVRTLSLRMPCAPYFTMVSLFADLLMYGEHTWVRVKGHPPLARVARELYDRPVARRWRRAWRYLGWVGRIRAWLLAFNEVAFRPDGLRVQSVARAFYLAQRLYDYHVRKQ